MNKGNWILNLILSVILLPSVCFMTACGEGEPKITSFNVYINNQPVSESNKTIDITYGDIDSIGNIEEMILIELIYDNGDSDMIDYNDENYSLTGLPSVFNAGTYSLEVKYKNFEAKTINVVIAKKNIDMLNTEWYYTNSIDFAGSEITVELTGIPAGITAVYQGNTAIDAGMYTASVSFDYDSLNYKLINNSVQNLQWQISKINPPIPTNCVGQVGEKLSTVMLPDGWAWNNAEQSLEISGSYTANYTESKNYLARSAVAIPIVLNSN